MNTFLNYSDSDAATDLEYFRSMIESKVQALQTEQNYQELLAMKQMGGEFDPEDELSDALDEIKKNEKELSTFANIAQTLFERMEETQIKVQEQESTIAAFDTRSQSMEQQLVAMQGELEDRNNQYEKLEMIKEDYHEQMEDLTARLKLGDERLELAEEQNVALVDRLDVADSKIQDMEYRSAKDKKDLENELNALMHKNQNLIQEYQATSKSLELKDREWKQASKQNQSLVKQLTSAEYKLSKLEKRHDKEKQHMRELEDKIIEKTQKIKQMELQKKNEDLCSQLEITKAGSGLVNELGELENMGEQQQTNMLDGQDDSIEPDALHHDDDMRMPKNSLFIAEGQDFRVDGIDQNFSYQDYQQDTHHQVRLSNGEQVDLPDNDVMYQKSVDSQSQKSLDMDAYQESGAFQQDVNQENNSQPNSNSQHSGKDFQNPQMYTDNYELEPNNAGQAFDYEPQPQTAPVEMIDQETQMDDMTPAGIEIQTQTSVLETRVAITQTAAVKYVSQDCQTTEAKMISKEVQVKFEAQVVSTGVDAEENFIERIEREVEERLKKEQEARQKKMKKLQLTIQPPDSSGGADTGGALLKPSQFTAPQTARAASIKLEVPLLDHKLLQSPGSQLTPSGVSTSSFSFREQSQLDYLLNRDPMQEFFTLTCQSIKLNSPHMNTICTIDTIQLYKKANQLGVPFFKWQTWIENFLNQEFLRTALRRRSKRGIDPSQKPQSKLFQKVEEETKKKVLDQARFMQKQLQDHQLAKDPKAAEKAKAQLVEKQRKQRELGETKKEQELKKNTKKALKGMSMFR